MKELELVVGTRIADYIVERVLPSVDEFIELVVTHVVLPRRATLVVRPATHATNEAAARKLLREACILEALQHPGVPRVYECGRLADRRPWFALEIIDGPNLVDAIADRALPVADTIEMLLEVAELLQHAHARGIIHSRLLPERIVHHDAGLCVTGWRDACTYDGAPPQLEPAGYQPYLAPELADGEAFDGRADVYSLGVIAYEALTLALPTMPLARRLSTVPERLGRLIDRMTSPVVRVRPSIDEVIAEATALSRPMAHAVADDDLFEAVEVELDFDISREPPPIPREARMRWTPANGYQSATEPADHRLARIALLSNLPTRR